MQSRSESSRGQTNGRGSRRGFAAMDPEDRSEIARQGGRVSHGRSQASLRDDDDTRSHRRASGRQGFASMSSSKQRSIASMGGRASHGGRGRSYGENDDSDNRSPSRGRTRSSGSGRQGFASMDPEKQREIASMGGRASHGGRSVRQSRGDDDRTQRRSGRSGSSRGRSSGNGRRTSSR